MEPTPVEQLIAALDGPLGRSALAKAVGINATGSKFRDALAEAVESGQIVKNEDGLYERGRRRSRRLSRAVMVPWWQRMRAA